LTLNYFIAYVEQYSETYSYTASLNFGIYTLYIALQNAVRCNFASQALWIWGWKVSSWRCFFL